MARTCIRTLVALAAALLLAPAAAQARTPCPDEQTVPNVVNAARVSDSVFCLTNQIRVHFGLPALRRDARLDEAARLHSVDMAVRDFFAHVNPDGLDPADRARRAGYLDGVGENIAFGYRDARSVVAGWVESEGHCHNMLSAARDIGLGTAFGLRSYYTQDFGDYFSQEIDEGPQSGCPYRGDIDTLAAAPSVPPAATLAVNPTDPHAAAAVVAPALRSLSVTRRLRAGTRKVRLSYRLTEDATVTFRIERVSGERTSTLPGRFTDAGAPGANSIRLAVRLRPGQYRVRAVASDDAGMRSAIKRARFTVLPAAG